MNLWDRHKDAIAQGCLTNSKHPQSFVFDVYPKHAQYGHGVTLHCADGIGYVDYICGLGTNLVGWGNTEIMDEIVRHVHFGNALSLATQHEIEAAELVKEMFPFTERVKFLKTGSEACSAALRMARAATGRVNVISQGYHGWHDDFVSLTNPAAGVPFQRWMSSDIENINSETAAVILEPVITDWSEARRDELREIRKKCDEVGALLIFDEIITGLRFSKFSVAKYFDVTPDIVCLGKALGGGFALSAVAGPAAILDNDQYFVSSTFAGEILPLVACKTLLKVLRRRIYDVEALWEEGTAWINRFNQMADGAVKLVGYPTRGAFEGDDLNVALFMQEACRARILFGKSWFYNFIHKKHDASVFAALEQIFEKIKTGKVTLDGQLPKSPFAARVRESSR